MNCRLELRWDAMRLMERVNTNVRIMEFIERIPVGWPEGWFVMINDFPSDTDCLAWSNWLAICLQIAERKALVGLDLSLTLGLCHSTKARAQRCSWIACFLLVLSHEPNQTPEKLKYQETREKSLSRNLIFSDFVRSLCARLRLLWKSLIQNW